MLRSTAPLKTPRICPPFLPPQDHRDGHLTITTWVQGCERKTQLPLIPYSFHELLPLLPPSSDEPGSVLLPRWTSVTHLQHRDNTASYPIFGIIRECLKRCHIPRDLQSLCPMCYVPLSAFPPGFPRIFFLSLRLSHGSCLVTAHQDLSLVLSTLTGWEVACLL